MADYEAHISWTRRAGDRFDDLRYSRVHTWRFDGGLTVPGSPSPHSVKAPYSDASALDPEEAFVASISSCHMLTFLYVAAKAGFSVQSYEDHAIGEMTRNGRGQLWMSRVTLRPAIAFDGARTPAAVEIDALHRAAHDECYIANSVRAEIVVERGDPAR